METQSPQRLKDLFNAAMERWNKIKTLVGPNVFDETNTDALLLYLVDEIRSEASAILAATPVQLGDDDKKEPQFPPATNQKAITSGRVSKKNLVKATSI